MLYTKYRISSSLIPHVCEKPQACLKIWEDNKGRQRRMDKKIMNIISISHFPASLPIHPIFSHVYSSSNSPLSALMKKTMAQIIQLFFYFEINCMVSWKQLYLLTAPCFYWCISQAICQLIAWWGGSMWGGWRKCVWNVTSDLLGSLHFCAVCKLSSHRARTFGHRKPGTANSCKNQNTGQELLLTVFRAA